MLLTVLFSDCSTYEVIHKFNSAMKTDAEHYPMFYPRHHQVSGHDIRDYSSIIIGCSTCNHSENYRIISYEVYFRSQYADKTKYIGIYYGNHFSQKLRKVINRNTAKYFSIEFRNIIVEVDSSKLINIGSLITFMSNPDSNKSTKPK